MTRVQGLIRFRKMFGEQEQRRLVAAVDAIARHAPFARPSTPNGQPLNLELTSAGGAGWWSDGGRGYHYAAHHPHTGNPWPEVPADIKLATARILRAARAAYPVGPFYLDTCLVNRYVYPHGRLGLHRDLAEPDKTAPIISISLGAPCLFLVGGEKRDDKIVERILLESGDALVMAGPARNAFHAVEKILTPMVGEPLILPDGVRLNLTIRQLWPREAKR